MTLSIYAACRLTAAGLTERRSVSVSKLTFWPSVRPRMPALAVGFVHYNFIRVHKTLRVSPAMAAGVTDHLWSWEDVITRMDALAPLLAPRGRM